MSTALLLSGGLDSLVVLHLLKVSQRKTRLFFVDYGQPSAKHERAAAEAIASEFMLPLERIVLDVWKEIGAGEIPHRNAILVFAAAAAGGTSLDAVATGIHGGVSYRDCSAEFISLLDLTLQSSGDGRPILLTPLQKWMKREIHAYAKREALPISLTYSCESGTIPPCGECLSCRDRAGLGC